MQRFLFLNFLKVHFLSIVKRYYLIIVYTELFLTCRMAKESLVRDAGRIWNQALIPIKLSKTLMGAKKENKKYCKMSIWSKNIQRWEKIKYILVVLFSCACVLFFEFISLNFYLLNDNSHALKDRICIISFTTKMYQLKFFWNKEYLIWFDLIWFDLICL